MEYIYTKVTIREIDKGFEKVDWRNDDGDISVEVLVSERDMRFDNYENSTHVYDRTEILNKIKSCTNDKNNMESIRR